MNAWHDMGWPARMALLASLAPLILAAIYLVRPDKRWLAITKALSVMSLFAGVGATISGCAALLHEIGTRQELRATDLPWIVTGLSERLVTTSAAFWGLACAWALVAIGTARRQRNA
jgi:hypothetical protein